MKKFYNLGTRFKRQMAYRLSLVYFVIAHIQSCLILLRFCVLSQMIQVTRKPPGPEVIKFSCSIQLILKFTLLINVKMPMIVGILTFISQIIAGFGDLDPKFNSFGLFQYFV